jgi:transcriptional regulator with XRE-family HTH domain
MSTKQMSPLRLTRVLSGLTLCDVYKGTSISPGLLSLIERDLYRPNEKYKRKISRVLKRPVEELFPQSEVVAR